MGKKIGFLVIALFAIFLMAHPVIAAELNGNADVAVADAKPEAVSVSIMTASGTTTSTVKLSSPWTPAITPYWVKVDLGGTSATKAKVTIKIKHSGNPFKKIIHKFNFGTGYNGSFLEPFGIADWGSTPTSGSGKIIVKTDVGTASTTFKIVR